MTQLIQDDCLIAMDRLIEEKIKVDAIITDPPYGTTECKWDIIIPLPEMWSRVNKLIKEHGAIVIFGNEPFTSQLICSNLKGFKYRIDWDKVIPSGMGYAKYRPMAQIEDICVFSSKGERANYFPQLFKRDKPIKSGGNTVPPRVYKNFDSVIDGRPYKKTYDHKQPTTLISFLKIRKGALHPTQKPVDMLEYLVKTYTQEENTILDFCMGSGTTGVACRNLTRNFIGIEINKEYFEIASKRIDKEYNGK